MSLFTCLFGQNNSMHFVDTLMSALGCVCLTTAIFALDFKWHSASEAGSRVTDGY